VYPRCSIDPSEKGQDFGTCSTCDGRDPPSSTFFAASTRSPHRARSYPAAAATISAKLGRPAGFCVRWNCGVGTRKPWKSASVVKDLPNSIFYRRWRRSVRAVTTLPGRVRRETPPLRGLFVYPHEAAIAEDVDSQDICKPTLQCSLLDEGDTCRSFWRL
jgi:hypothetical protein